MSNSNLYCKAGLVSECRKYIQTYKLPNIIDDKWNLSMEKLYKSWNERKLEKSIKKEFAKYSKLMNKNLEEESLKITDYVESMKLRDARMFFRLRSGMVNAKMNRKNEK